MAKGALAFQIKDQPKGITERVRRAIGQADISVPGVQRLITAIESLKLKATAPIHYNDCWAHVGIEKLRVAIYTKEHLEYAKVEFERELWEKRGWVLLAIARRSINRMTDEQLTAQLKEALVELGKVK